MKIKMKTIMAGPDGTAAPGQVLDLPKSEAYSLCEAGYAEQVKDGGPRKRGRRGKETAEMAAGETAALDDKAESQEG